MPLGPNDIVGSDFKLIRSLARGGMGEVFEAEQISTGSKRALKLMHPELVEDAKLRASPGATCPLQSTNRGQP